MYIRRILANIQIPNYRRFLSISISLYVIALFTPIFNGSDDIGLTALVFGIFGDDIYHVLAWFTNILYFTNLIIGRKGVWIGITISLITIIFGFFAIKINDVLIHEGGLTKPVTVGIGFYLWMLSFLTLLTGQLLNWKKKSSR